MDAVFFDMDGLLVDTEKLWFQVESDVMRRLGAAWTQADQENLVGGSMPATVAYMLRVAGSDRDPAEIEAWMLDGVLALLAEGFDVMPGALELLGEIRAAGVPTGLVTSSARLMADAVLNGVGREHFDIVVTGDDVRNFKPAPEPYLLAAERVGVPPARCVALEDSPNGVAAATAAGCAVVAVPSVVPVPPAPRRLVVESLKQVDVAALRALAAS
ncbi:phosphoglycolate phosphatase [Sphaerisporangium siamense]|uniref:HAD superfamily hydrolase (TIGR01509 family) n=1 Tax=Sphaerisporangium siamense TaxID=795645 RepID=A0A7W7GC57_9ACTN|nr:HAD family phosphatase [Sphaerisporangium siamense]MBB4703540.1 HAD superfamily hydrolase (TIGR01509 family) [Sphaerisporangium siamense]GII82011.1 phosphoglycolate phosphatase [Sphaerisporangium siamense]